MAHKIDSPAARAKLPARRSPYWFKVQTNRFIGYRYMTPGAEGNWSAKVQDGRADQHLPMGKLTEIPEKDRFAHALKVAAKWFAELEASAGITSAVLPYKLTLVQALEAYTREQGKKRKPGDPDFGAKSMAEVKRRFEQLVTPYPTPAESWVDRPLVKISAHDFALWRAWLRDLPNKGRGVKAGEPRSEATINRDLVPVTAALNLAHERHGIPNVWKKALKKTKIDDHGKGEEVYLTQTQRAKFLHSLTACGDAEAGALLPLATAMNLLPVRPGALAALTAAHYEAAQHQVHIYADKAGAGRRLRMPKEPVTLSLFKGSVKDKLPGAHLFSDSKGRKWIASRWQKATKRAAKHAGLPAAMTLYWLRHSRITDLVGQGHSASAIAKMAGTSAAMIEKHYFHWTADKERDALLIVAA